MTTATTPHHGRRAALLAGILTAIVASSSSCDVGCDLPDPDGWRHSMPPEHPAPAAMAAGPTPTPG